MCVSSLSPNPNPNSVYTHVWVYRIVHSHQQFRDLYVQSISTSTFVDASRRPADPHVRISKPSQTTSGHRPRKPRPARLATSLAAFVLNNPDSPASGWPDSLSDHRVTAAVFANHHATVTARHRSLIMPTITAPPLLHAAVRPDWAGHHR